MLDSTVKFTDLSPCDLLWGYLKDKVYVTPSETLQILMINRISTARREIPPNER
jgi:hypothetical protein